MGFLNSLEVLVLSNNNLYGEIPSSLRNCSLRSIDLGGNYLSGNLPSWIGSHVLMLHLHSNLFSGIIPRQWCNLPSLHILDLAQNNLYGVIPDCLDNLTALIYGYNNSYFAVNYYKEETMLVTKGQELLYGRILEFVSSIDLSGNHLTGEIPNELSCLIELGIVNLSINHLTGNIPQNIGNLRWLETLDLSKNSLSRPIPKRGETFDGPTITSSSVDDKQDGNDYERLWFYVSIGLGFVVGFWSVCCTLLVKKSWRHWEKPDAYHIKAKSSLRSSTNIICGVNFQTTTMSQDYSVKALFRILDTKRGNSSSQLAEVLPDNHSSLSPLRIGTQNAQVGSALLHKDDGTTPKMQAQFLRQKNKGVQSDTVPSVIGDLDSWTVSITSHFAICFL
uniref:Uncharacterized protein n=1 Tax=Quercus lobata TaxID=97700 RepID=A0A7N2LLQ1_QUELO